MIQYIHKIYIIIYIVHTICLSYYRLRFNVHVLAVAMQITDKQSRTALSIFLVHSKGFLGLSISADSLVISLVIFKWPVYM